MTLMQPCAECGEPTEGTRCREHISHRPKAKASARGYDTTWRKLSERARRLQPFCTDCGAVEDLTLDHSSQAWERKAAGKAIRLCDVAVVCRTCNAARGRARPPADDSATRGGDPEQPGPDPRGEAEFANQIASRR